MWGEGWLPFVNTYRTLCVAPPKEIISLFMLSRRDRYREHPWSLHSWLTALLTVTTRGDSNTRRAVQESPGYQRRQHRVGGLRSSGREDHARWLHQLAPRMSKPMLGLWSADPKTRRRECRNAGREGTESLRLLHQRTHDFYHPIANVFFALTDGMQRSRERSATPGQPRLLARLRRRAGVRNSPRSLATGNGARGRADRPRPLASGIHGAHAARVHEGTPAVRWLSRLPGHRASLRASPDGSSLLGCSISSTDWFHSRACSPRSPWRGAGWSSSPARWCSPV